MISDLRISRLLTLNYDTEIEEEFRRLYRSTGTSRDEVKPRGRQAPPESAFDVLCGTDFCADEATSLRLHGEFGVLSLFYGGQPLRTVLLALALLNAAHPNKAGNDPTAVTRTVWRAAALELIDSLGKLDDNLLDENKSRRLQGHLQQLASPRRTRPPTLPDKALLDALKNEVRSRALTAKLKKLEAKCEDWWQHWRKAPVERSSKFRQNYLEQAKSQKIPTLARHRPVYEALPSSQTFRSLTKLNRLARDAAEQIDGERLRVLPATVPVADKLRGGHIRKLNTNYGRFFRELANSGGAPVRDFNVVPPRRIVRACMPRGSGKGALLHILQQPVDSGDRRHLDMLFEDPSPKGMNRYHGAFCLHLSFSMEFASVISALSEFVEHALVGVLVEHTKAVLDAIPRLAALNPEFEKSFPGILYANQAAITAPLVTYLAKDAKTLSPKKLIA